MIHCYFKDGNGTAKYVWDACNFLSSPAHKNKKMQELYWTSAKVSHVEILIVEKLFSDKRKCEQAVRSAKVFSEYSVTGTSTAEIRGLYIVYLLLHSALHSKIIVLQRQYL